MKSFSAVFVDMKGYIQEKRGWKKTMDACLLCTDFLPFKKYTRMKIYG